MDLDNTSVFRGESCTLTVDCAVASFSLSLHHTGLSGDSFELTKWYISSTRRDGFYRLSPPGSLPILVHGSFSMSSSSLFIAISVYFAHIQFSSIPGTVEALHLFSLHLFILVFASSFPSHCVVLCVCLSFFFLCWGWLGKIWEQQGSSLVTHQLWNLSVSRRQEGGRAGKTPR